MDHSVFMCGDLDPWPTQHELTSILTSAGLDLVVGRYSIRIRDCDHFVFQEYGGDLGDPQIDADADSLEIMRRDAGLISEALTAADIKHRFEIYNATNTMVAYFHHNWPEPTD